jgi:hypothetical protein
MLAPVVAEVHQVWDLVVAAEDSVVVVVVVAGDADKRPDRKNYGYRSRQ